MSCAACGPGCGDPCLGDGSVMHSVEPGRRRDMHPLRQFWLNTVAASPIFSTRVRVRLLRLGGVRVGRATASFPRSCSSAGTTCPSPTTVRQRRGLFDAGARIELQAGVAVGPRVQFLTSTHPVGPPSRRAASGLTTIAPIVVGEGTWVGAGAIVLSGVRIGSGCVIGAGAVVTTDCEPNGLYVGVPAFGNGICHRARRMRRPPSPRVYVFRDESALPALAASPGGHRRGRIWSFARRGCQGSPMEPSPFGLR